MSLLTPKTPLQTELYRKDAHILRCAEAAHNLAATLNNAHTWLWGQPPASLLRILNADVALTQATFEANTALGTAVNKALDLADLPEFSARAPVTVGRTELAFDGLEFSLPPAPPPSHNPDDPALWPARSDPSVPSADSAS